MKIFITGGTGLIGRALITHLIKNKKNTLYTSIHTDSFVNPHVTSLQIDITNHLDAIKKISMVKPDVIIHLAAATHIDNCEKEKSAGINGLPWKLNVEATKILAQYCATASCKMIYLSTECVFDGKSPDYTESSEPNPINWYGKTKSLGEENIIQSGCEYTILRTINVYGLTEKSNLLITILNSLGVGKPFPAVTDQYLSPVEVSEVCQVITEILDKNLQGILHFASEELISPYQMANAVAEHFLLDKSLIEPVSLGSFFGKKKASLRLKYSSFKSIESLGKISIKASSFATYLKLDHFKKITF